MTIQRRHVFRRCRRRLMSRDKKAIQILLDTYWSPKGWKRDRTIDSADFEHARQAGYMFDPVTVTHDDIIARLLTIRNRVRGEQVTDSFLASLSTRRLELRSALGSFSLAADFPDRRLLDKARGPLPSGRLQCRLCGLYGDFTAEQEDL